MNVPRFCLGYAIAGAIITTVTERVLSGYYGELMSCMVAMMCLSFFAEAVARSIKVPATVIVMPATIPLLPGSAIYYSMYYGISGNNAVFSYYLKSTVFTGMGIALGTIISSILIRVAQNIKYD